MTEENPDKEPAQQLLFADLVSNYQEGRDELNLAEFPISAIPHDTPLLPLGAWALPGSYTVRLTVDGKTYNVYPDRT